MSTDVKGDLDFADPDRAVGTRGADPKAQNDLEDRAFQLEKENKRLSAELAERKGHLRTLVEERDQAKAAVDRLRVDEPAPAPDTWFGKRNSQAASVAEDPTLALILVGPSESPHLVLRSGMVQFGLENDPPWVLCGWTVINTSPYVLAVEEEVSGQLLLGDVPFEKPFVVLKQFHSLGYLGRGHFSIKQFLTTDERERLERHWDKELRFDPGHLIVYIHSDSHDQPLRWKLKSLRFTPSDIRS